MLKATTLIHISKERYDSILRNVDYLMAGGILLLRNHTATASSRTESGVSNASAGALVSTEKVSGSRFLKTAS